MEHFKIQSISLYETNAMCEDFPNISVRRTRFLIIVAGHKIVFGFFFLCVHVFDIKNQIRLFHRTRDSTAAHFKSDSDRSDFA